MEKVATKVLKSTIKKMTENPSFSNTKIEKEEVDGDIVSIKLTFKDSKYIILMPMNKGMYIRKVVPENEKVKRINHDFLSWGEYSFEKLFFKKNWDDKSPVQFG